MLTKERKEKISAFLDDDMHRDELMSFSLSGEVEDAGVAQRYQMIGDALRGELGDSSFIDISSAVRAAVSEEETYSITQRSHAANGTADRADNSQRDGFLGLSSWFRPVAGMAMAASVAVVMVFTLSEQPATNSQLTADADQGAGQSPIQLAVDNKAQKDVNIAVSGRAVSGQGSGAPSQDGQLPVNPYLFNQHLEYATQDALQGRLPLVRAVSYEAEK